MPENPFDTVYCPICKQPTLPRQHLCESCRRDAERCNARETPPSPHQGWPIPTWDRADWLLIGTIAAYSPLVLLSIARAFSFAGLTGVVSYLLPWGALFDILPFALVLVDVWQGEDRFGWLGYLGAGVLVVGGIAAMLGSLHAWDSLSPLLVPYRVAVCSLMLVALWKRYGPPAELLGR